MTDIILNCLGVGFLAFAVLLGLDKYFRYAIGALAVAIVFLAISW